MLGKLLKGAAYAKSPKRAFGFFHPIKAAKIGAGLWLARKIFGGSKKRREGQAHA